MTQNTRLRLFATDVGIVVSLTTFVAFGLLLDGCKAWLDKYDPRYCPPENPNCGCVDEKHHTGCADDPTDPHDPSIFGPGGAKPGDGGVDGGEAGALGPNTTNVKKD